MAKQFLQRDGPKGRHYGAAIEAGDLDNVPIVTETDIEITDEASGYILKSPDGTRYRIKVADGGALSTEPV